MDFSYLTWIIFLPAVGAIFIALLSNVHERLIKRIAAIFTIIPLILSTWLIGKVVVFYAANQITLGVMLIIVAVLLVKQLLNSKTDPMPEKEKNEMVRYGKHLTAIGGITTLQNRTDALLVSALLPLATMADYSIGLLVRLRGSGASILRYVTHLLFGCT